MSNPIPNLDWLPVLLVKVAREPFAGTACGVLVSRLHLALHPDGVVMSAWDVPEPDRRYPSIRLVGWKPERDVPFNLPIRFKRQGDPRVLSRISNGTWVLPYDEELYQLYLRLQHTWQMLMARIDSAPHSPYTLGFVRSLLAIPSSLSGLN